MDFLTFWVTIIVKNPFKKEGPPDFPFSFFLFLSLKNIFENENEKR